jgi:radical SAM protein (TIGR01212 family)
MRPYYYSLNEYIRQTYNTKMYKLSLSGGMTCPNRDGLIDNRGCIFCSAGGSGDFTGAALSKDNNIDIQIDTAKALVSRKYSGSDYIAYFQSYTNTYADVNYLRRLFYDVVKRPEIRILSIATRPDCLSSDIIELLAELNSIKPVWIELGLQTIHERTAKYIRRGYTLDVFEEAVRNLNRIGIRPIVHMIIGLPGENESMILETAKYLSHCNISGVKLQLLHVLKNTDLAQEYFNGSVDILSLTQYSEILGKIIKLLPPDCVIHRLTGDGPKNLLIAPLWSSNKKNVINTINRYLQENAIIQGSEYIPV